MTRWLALMTVGLVAAQVVAQGQDQPSEAPAAQAAADSEPSGAKTAKAEGESAKQATQSSDDLPEAGAAAAAAQQKSPEELAKEKAKKEFEETVARFKKVSDEFNAEIMATIKRKRDARMRRIDIDFEQRIGEPRAA